MKPQQLLLVLLVSVLLCGQAYSNAGPSADYREFNFMRYFARRELTDAKCKVRHALLCICSTGT